MKDLTNIIIQAYLNCVHSITKKNIKVLLSKLLR